jgi:hypothetical protein
MTRRDANLLLVGTRKGAFIFTSKDGRKTWKSSGPHFRGKDINHIIYDRRNGLLLAAVNDEHWGPSIARSFDLGTSWTLPETPPKFPKGSGLSVSTIWHLEPGDGDHPDDVYLGVAPACLFKSEDKGENWQVNDSLLNHRTRKKWQPGGGGLCLHTILVDPTDRKRMHIGISAVGTLFTEDGGEKWEFQNKNVLAGFLPDRYPVYGQCVHKMARTSAKRNVIYQQNHCGVYRSDNNGKDWTDIRNNLPSRFGFPISVDANDAKRVYVAPLEGDFARIPPDGHFAVWASDNSGKEWFPLDHGLPKTSYFTLLREGMTSDEEDPGGLYFGTTTGQLFCSRNRGEEWSRITDALPPILSVSVSRN